MKIAKILTVLFFRPNGFIGFYIDEDELVFDFEDGQKERIKAFVKHKCSEIFEKHKINFDKQVFFVGQKSKFRFSGKRGAGLSFIPEGDDEIAEMLMQDPDLTGVTCVQNRCIKHNYKRMKKGSLGFFAVEDKPLPDDEPSGMSVQGEASAALSSMEEGATALPKGSPFPRESAVYIVTARHLFKDWNCPDDGKVTGHYFSEQVLDRVRKVSNESNGILGRHELQSERKALFVDFAFIPIEHKTTENYCFQAVPTVFNGNLDNLIGKRVEKFGMVSKNTQGKVIRCNYNPFVVGDSATGECVFIESINDQPFSTDGDSGSLVIRKLSTGQTQAIGITSMVIDTWNTRRGPVKDITVAVPLKNCFKAVEEKFGLRLKLFSEWEKCEIQPL